jgi:hypothetical protein
MTQPTGHEAADEVCVIDEIEQPSGGEYQRVFEQPDCQTHGFISRIIERLFPPRLRQNFDAYFVFVGKLS